MISKDRLLRLRLAARTLIEWKVPVSTERYQTVLADILSIHPYAYDWGLRVNNKVFDIDERGTLLWYLSETLNSDKPTFSSTYSLSLGRDLSMDDVGRYLLELGLGGLFSYSYKSNQITWREGPTRERVAELVQSAIGSKEDDVRTLGYEALIAISIDGPNGIFQQNIKELTLANILMTKNRWSSVSGFLGRYHTQFLILTIAASTALSLILFKEIPGSTTTRALLSGAFFLLFVLTGFYFRATFATNIFKRYVGLLHGSANRLETFRASLPKIFLKNNGIFRAAVNHNEKAFSLLALEVTDLITKEGVEVVLTSLLSAETPITLRDQYFRWLCRIKVAS